MKTMLKYVMVAAVFAGANVCAMETCETKETKKDQSVIAGYYKTCKKACKKAYAFGGKILGKPYLFGTEENNWCDKQHDKYENAPDYESEWTKNKNKFATQIILKDYSHSDALFQWGLKTPKKTGLAALVIGAWSGYLLKDKAKIGSMRAIFGGALGAYVLSYFPQLVAKYMIEQKAAFLANKKSKGDIFNSLLSNAMDMNKDNKTSSKFNLKSTLNSKFDLNDNKKDYDSLSKLINELNT